LGALGGLALQGALRDGLFYKYLLPSASLLALVFFLAYPKTL
jgi:hypothetical protein